MKTSWKLLLLALLATGLRAQTSTLLVPGFRPEADVNGLENTGPAITRTVRGNGDCFAIASLIPLFFARTWFDPTAPAPAGPLDYKLLIEHVLGEAPGRYRIGGHPDLVRFTDPGRSPDGALWFKTWADLIQHAAQLAVHVPGGALDLARAYPLPLRAASPLVELLATSAGVVGAGSVNLPTVAEVRDAIAAGRPVPLMVFGPEGGHAIVAFGLDEYPDRFELLCHDVNDPPNLRGGVFLRRVAVDRTAGTLAVRRVPGGEADPFYADWPLIAVVDPFRPEVRRRLMESVREPARSTLVSAHLDALAGKDRPLMTRAAGLLGLALWAGEEVADGLLGTW